MPTNQMPHNIDAEAALLGCILIDAEVQADLMGELTEEDFYQDSHREILIAMKKIYASRKVIDTVTLTDRLDNDGTLERAGGIRRITELAEATPSAANYKQYLEIVKRDAVNRALIRAAHSIIESSKEGKEEREAISFAEKLVYDISKKEDRDDLTGLQDGETVMSVIDKFEQIQSDPHAFRGLETGFTQLDRITNGLQKSNLIVIAARPGVGKTSLAMNIVEHACLVNGKVAAVFSLEMPREEIVQRLICAYAKVSMEKALSGKLGQSEWRNLVRASDKLKKSKIYIDPSSRVTPAEILSKCRRLAAREGRLDLVMIDYIQLMGGDNASLKGGNTFENRQQEVSQITRSLKIMAKELNVPVIALSQLRRIQTQEPQLSDLRESGAIEQDADIVMFISRPDVTASAEDMLKKNIVKGAADLIIAKHRNGSLGRVALRFIGERTSFIDAEDQGRPDEEPGSAPPPRDESYGGFGGDDGFSVPPPDDDMPPDGDI